MPNVEFVANPSEELGKTIGIEFEKYAAVNGIDCNYTPFTFTARLNNEVVGIITGHSYYNEAHISDLVVLEPYRDNYIGSALVRNAENYCKDRGFTSISLSTYHFQAPEFYTKIGYQIEFIRENNKNPKLSKYFFIKYFDNK